MSRKAKTKNRKKGYKKYLYVLIFSFIVSLLLISKNQNSFLTQFLLNDITNKNLTKAGEVLNGITSPTNIVYASFNDVVEKEDLSTFNNVEDNYKYENKNTEYVEDPNPKKTTDPTVYLYNTHQLEEYAGAVENDYNVRPNVLIASYILKEKLEEKEIPTLVETANIKQYMNKHGMRYSKSYLASKIFLKDKIKNYKSLTYFIDIHRDSSKKKITTVNRNNKNYAKVLFVIGAENKNYKKNLAFTTKINNALNIKVPNISRGISKKQGKNVNGIYNQDLHPNIILIEIGGIENTLEEINNTTEVLSEVISNYIKETK